MIHATVKDMAKLAGVSTATVSRVINARSTVSPSARTAVIAAIDQLQYIPNRNASELALIVAIKRRRGRLHVVVPAAVDRPKKRRPDVSLMCALDARACDIASIDKRIEALQETVEQIEAQLKRIEYALARPGNLMARR